MSERASLPSDVPSGGGGALLPPEVELSRHDVKRVADTLRTLGEAHDGLYPWHRTSDPYTVLVAEVLLKRTTRTVIARVLPVFLEAYPSAEVLADAAPDDVYHLISPVGLEKRTKRLPLLAKSIVESGGLVADRESLLALPEVGAYAADATLLYAFGISTFPRDRNVQRVLHRLLRGEHPDRKVDPYKDDLLELVIPSLTSGMSVDEIRALHQGVMSLAWTWCRPIARCDACEIATQCCMGRATTIKSEG